MRKSIHDYSSDQLILFHDERFCVVNKPPGIPSQPDKTGDLSMLDWLGSQFSKTTYLANRLDRPVGGIMLFTWSPSWQKRLSQPGTLKKIYAAFVHKNAMPPDQTVMHFLKRDPHRRKSLVSVQPKKDYKKAVLHYQVIRELDRYLLIKVELSTGRFHQIRAQLSALGCPVKGDVKYGARRKNPDRSIDLHAYSLTIPSMDLYFTAPSLHSGLIWKEFQGF